LIGRDNFLHCLELVCLGAAELCFGDSLDSYHMLDPVPKKRRLFIHTCKNNAKKC